MPDRGRKSPRDPFDLGENPITPLVEQRHERFGEEVVIDLKKCLAERPAWHFDPAGGGLERSKERN